MNEFNSILCFVPPRLRAALERLPPEEKHNVFEIRLRAGQPVVLTYCKGNKALDNSPAVSASEVEQCFQMICSYSVYAHSEELAQGFVMLPHGHRAGIAGKAVVSGGIITAFKNITSVNLRIARQINGAAENSLYRIKEMFGEIVSFFYFGPPGSGKTTLLRDTARIISGSGKRCVLIDERGEIASDGGFNLGINCDIISAVPKAPAIEMALRTLNPQVILFDEIGSAEECRAVSEGFNAGVNIITTAHAGSVRELEKRRVTRNILRSNVFKCAVGLDAVGAEEQFFILEEEQLEVNRNCTVIPVVGGRGVVKKFIS